MSINFRPENSAALCSLCEWKKYGGDGPCSTCDQWHTFNQYLPDVKFPRPYNDFPVSFDESGRKVPSAILR